MTLCIVISTCQYVRDEIKRFDEIYAERMEEHLNILATNLMKEVKTTGELKKKLPQDSCA